MREISFEEARLQHYKLAAQGQEAQAVKQFQSACREAEAQNQNAICNTDEAIKYMLDGLDRRPNRFDICKNEEIQYPAHPFSTPSPSPLRSPFGVPNPFLSRQVSQGAGQATEHLGSTSGHGTVPSLASSSSAPVLSNPFARASPVLSNPFARLSPSSSPFGPPPPQAMESMAGAQTHARNPFARKTSTPTNSPFLSMSARVQPGPKTQTYANNPFVRNDSTEMNVTISSPAKEHSGTAASTASQWPTQPNPFSNAVPQKTARSVSSQPVAGTTISQPSIIAQAQNQNTTMGEITAPENTARISTWDGQSVSYLKDQAYFRTSKGELQRIWFPQGPPKFVTVDIPVENYTAHDKDCYAFLKQNGVFKDGSVPLIAPRREWCDWHI